MNALVVIQVLLLAYAAMTDIGFRRISNIVCVLLAVLAATQLPFSDPYLLALTFGNAVALLVPLLILYHRGYMGGGDVKLLAAVAIGLSISQIIQLLTVTVLAGGVLAVAHLVLRYLPSPKPAPAGSSFLRRVYAVERWRHVRRAALPFGVAIAFGGICSVLSGVDNVV
jgi:prepilin peptidase CpaA